MLHATLANEGGNLRLLYMTALPRPVPPASCSACAIDRTGPSSVRVEVIGPGGRVATSYGTWSRAALDQIFDVTQPIPSTERSPSVSVRLTLNPDDRELRLFVDDALVYTAVRRPNALRARVLLLSEPEHALAIAVHPAEHPLGFATLEIDTPLTMFPSLPLVISAAKAGGCWRLLTLGDGAYVDPLAVTLSDGFRTTAFYLPAQHGVAAIAPRLDVPEDLRGDEAVARAPTVPRAPGGVPRSDLHGADLHRHAFHRAPLAAANLSGADLRKSRWHSVHARGADFRRARLQHAHVSYGDFQEADFREADLSGARFSGSDLRDADLRGATLAGTRFDRVKLGGADLREARKLVQAQLDRACGDVRTQLPAGLHLSTCR